MEVQEHDIYPSQSGFQPELGKFLKTVDSIRYEFVPPRVIKHIHHLHYYQYQGNIIYGNLPATPLSIPLMTLPLLPAYYNCVISIPCRWKDYQVFR